MTDFKSDIESRFQILITLSVFLPTLIYAMGKAAHESDGDSNNLALQVGFLIGSVLIDYIIFQSSKSTFSENSLKHINTILLWSIGLFIIPIWGLAMGTYNFTAPIWVVHFLGFSLALSIFAILAVPVIIELFLVIFSIASDKK